MFLNYYKKIIALKKENRILQYGDFIAYKESVKDYFGFYRVLNGERLFIEINISEHPRPSMHPKAVTHLIVSSADNNTHTLMPYEARIYRLQNL